MLASAMLAFALALNAWALAAEQPNTSFQRAAAVKLLGYDPEQVDLCKMDMHRDDDTHRLIASPEGQVAAFLKAAGEIAAAHACPSRAHDAAVIQMFAKPDETATPSQCAEAADSAGGEITPHVSDMMSNEHPDVVAAYVDGVAGVLRNIRDACTASKEAWAKVAAQTLLFENRASTIRQGRVCALWRLALDKELKAATEVGKSRGRAAGLTYFQTRTSAALDGAHHYCAEDSTSSFVDANVGLTKMLLDTMPEK